MKQSFELGLIRVGLSVFLSTCSTLLGADSPAASFIGKETLLRPGNYREWIFVGSTFGLRYDKDPEAKKGAESPAFTNVYIDPQAYRIFSRTGEFPEGTVFILEIASSASKAEPGLQGIYQNGFTALEASVKDGRRFKDGWAYFSFDGGDGKLLDRAEPLPSANCFSCHARKAATDNVFTQFYPALRSVKPLK